MAERLRRMIRNHMGYARVGSNPTAVVYIRALLAEWSKAADLSSVIFGCVGSNPTGCMYKEASLAQLGERQTEDLKVPGSIPGGGNYHKGNVPLSSVR